MKNESFNLTAMLGELAASYAAAATPDAQAEAISLLWSLSQAIVGERDYGQNHRGIGIIC